MIAFNPLVRSLSVPDLGWYLVIMLLVAIILAGRRDSGFMARIAASEICFYSALALEHGRRRHGDPPILEIAVSAVLAAVFAYLSCRRPLKEAPIIGGINLFPTGWLVMVLFAHGLNQLRHPLLQFSVGSVGIAASVVWCAIFPLLMLRLIRQSREAIVRRKADLLSKLEQSKKNCDHCGYDIRHQPQRCPECGEPTVFTIEVQPPPAAGW